MKYIVIAALVIVAGALGGCQQVGGLLTRTAQPAAGTPPLQDIQSVADLQKRFQADAGKPRLVLLVSPT